MLLLLFYSIIFRFSIRVDFLKIQDINELDEFILGNLGIEVVST